MVLKKKVSAVVEEAPSSLEESVVKEERKTPMTQVVEVVEDSGSMEEPTMANDPVPEVNVASEELQDEKRKVLVDELFQKKPTASVEMMPEITAHRSQKKNPIVYWAIGIVSACIVIGISLVLFSGNKGIGMPSIVLVPTATPTPVSATPSPTVSPVSRDTVSIQVLNGGGKAGAATKMKKTLEEKGYTVKDTGNTEEYTYDKTEIHVKATKKDARMLLEADLKESYTLGTSAADLEDSVAYDVRVIVGKE